MAAYHFAPSPDLSTNETNYATWHDAFSESELSDIRQIGDALALDQASIEGNRINPETRKSLTGWIGIKPETQFIYDRLAHVARCLNGQFFDFELYGFVEDMQYTIYTSEEDHYTWHMDKGLLTMAPRKLSLVLQLSDPSEYEGGDLELNVGQIITTEKKKGLIYAFPSWLLHRVTPVTRGTRKTLVVWTAGPKFR